MRYSPPASGDSGKLDFGGDDRCLLHLQFRHLLTAPVEEPGGDRRGDAAWRVRVGADVQPIRSAELAFGGGNRVPVRLDRIELRNGPDSVDPRVPKDIDTT